MIFNISGGGGTPLNFKVVGGTSAPSNPKENTIWVNTDAEITGWHFGADEPNVYKLQNEIQGDGSVDTRVYFAPHKLSEGEIVSFAISHTVTYAFEWLTIIDAFGSYQRYCIRNMDKTSPAIWEKGTKVSVRISNDETALDVHRFRTAYIVGWGTYTAEEGTVWIQTGTTSTVAMNVLKKNSIQVYPISANQYVNGAWVAKNAKTYQGGAWVDLVTRADLYKNGDECSQITGGWSYQKNTASYWNGASNLTKNANSFTVSVSSQNGHGGAMTNNAIDVSSKGVLVVNITDFERSGSTGRCVVILSKARDFAANNYANRVAEFEFENKGAHSIDISSVNEPCYILVAAAGEGHTCSVTCDEVYVE